MCKLKIYSIQVRGMNIPSPLSNECLERVNIEFDCMKTKPLILKEIKSFTACLDCFTGDRHGRED